MSAVTTPNLNRFAARHHLAGLSPSSLAAVATDQHGYSIDKAQRFLAFQSRIKQELLRHRVIIANPYTAWFRHGVQSGEQIKAFIEPYLAYDAFVCGPAPYMKMVTTVLRELEFPRERRHQEKFVSLGGNPFGDIEEMQEAEREIADAESDDAGDDGAAAEVAGPAGPVKLEVELDGSDHTFDDWDPKVKLLEFLESKGVKAPYSCREGECSACAIRLLEGEVRMLHNDVLDEEDLADGIRLGCQSLPMTDNVRVTYS